MSQPPFTKNAADEEQVKQAKSREKTLRDRELNDLRHILDTVQGRRFIWRFMSHCKAFGSVWEPSARIHYNAGQQDIGHYLMAEVVAAKEDSLLQMMKEAKQGEM